jgi:hypothetical protein
MFVGDWDGWHVIWLVWDVGLLASSFFFSLSFLHDCDGNGWEGLECTIDRNMHDVRRLGMARW